MRNRKRSPKTAATLLIAGIACVFVISPAGYANAEESTRLLVQLEKSGSTDRVEALTGISVIDVAEIKTQHSSGLDDWIIVEVTKSEAVKVAQDLAGEPEIKQVEQEGIYYAQAITPPNDPLFSEQYGLRSGLYPDADIDALEAWEKTTGSSDVVIAIIDGGVDLNHEDLKDKIWTNSGEIAGNTIDDDGNGYIDDVKGWDFVASGPAGIAIDHATNVAGIAAASSNNGVGIAGISWGSRIMSLRVLGSGYGRESDIVSAVAYAVDNGAKVINMSIAGTGSDAMVDAMEYAFTHGVTVVAAVGNYGVDTGAYSMYPACAERNGINMVLGVGATDTEGQPAYFSNYGTCVDISAPGEKILSSVRNNRYDDMTGTSMSSPFAAGVAALYLSLHPGAAPSEVITAVMNGNPFTGSDADQHNARYKGKLSAALALGVSSGAGSGSSDSGDDSTGGSGTNDDTSGGSGSGDSNGGNGGGDTGDGSGGGGGDSGGGGGDSGGGGDDSSSGDSGSVSQKPAKPKVAGAKTVKPNLALIPKINAAFRSVFGRNPNAVEHAYWYGRVKRGEKQTFTALVGAMAFQKSQGRTYSSPPDKGGQRGVRVGVVAGAVTTSLISKINTIHRQAYGRNPTVSEHAYWLSRVTSGDKTTEAGLLGAMTFHRMAGILH